MGPGVSEVNMCASECGGVMEATEPGRSSVKDATRTGVALVETIGGFGGGVGGELELKLCR